VSQQELLILTERRKLPRVIDAILTLLAWCVFVYLFLHGFIAVLETKATAREYVHFGLFFATVSTLATYLVIGLINALVLLSWAWYNQFRRRGPERRSSIPALTSEQILNSFELPEHLLQTLREHQICSVHNDDQGNIVGVSVGSIYALHSAQPFVAGVGPHKSSGDSVQGEALLSAAQQSAA
jgi:biofilm PGA synthesis protein PgaD